MSTELSISEQAAPVAKWKAILNQAMPSIVDALPKHITAEKFQQVAKVAIGSTPALKQCLENNPSAVLTALANCAKDGLLPDGKEAALVPFKNNLTYIPMISGVLKRMRNSGEIDSISSSIVHEKDVFTFVQGDDERLTHEPNWKSDRGEPVAAYAIIRMTSGEIYREVMSKHEIEKVKAASRAKGGPWSGPFVLEMWRKTVLKRAAKYCPLSDERIRDMLDRDNSLYDMQSVDREPSPAQQRFKHIRDETARPRYDASNDEVPAIDIAQEEEEIIDVVPVDVGEPAGEEPPHAPDAAGSPTPDEEAPFPGDDVSEPSKASKAFYAESLAAVRDAANSMKTTTLNKVKLDPLWVDLPSGQKRLIEATAKAKK